MILKDFLKKSIEKQPNRENEENIKINNKGTKNILQRSKFRKFNYVKYNPEKENSLVNADDYHQPKRSYPSVVKGNKTPFR